MFGRLRGVIVERSVDGSIVIEVGGVGYEVAVPMGTLGRLAEGADVTLHVHTHVREDAIALFGFASTEDRAAFRTLMGVSSVGPKLAMAVLSHLDAFELADAIARGDGARFKGIPGVGKKIADRLLLELRDKFGFLSSSAPTPGAPSKPVAVTGPLAQVAGMLVAMGYKPHEADRAVASVAADAEGKSIDALLREALAAAS